MSVARQRLDALAQEYGLGPEFSEAMAIVLDCLAIEHASVSSVRDPAAAANVHVADSLAGLAVAELGSARQIADLGAGGGFPGLVLAAALPAAQVTLVESVSRKCAFVERTAAAAGLGNVTVACVRAEEWAAGMSACDAVTARAVAPLSVLCEYAAPLLSDGGVMVAWKGRRDPAEEHDGAAAAAAVGLEQARIVQVTPFTGAGERHLYVYSKVRDTPARFPRRAGMARKRPLRG